MNPKTYARTWLHDNHCSARDLSIQLGRSHSYVSNLLMRLSEHDGVIKGLDKIVHFPAEMKTEYLGTKKKYVKVFARPDSSDYVKRAIETPSLINWPVPNGELKC